MITPQAGPRSSEKSANESLLGILLVLGSAIGFSGKSILIKLAYGYGVDAVTLLALRMLFSLPMFLVCAIWSRQRSTRNDLSRRDWIEVLGLGLLGYYLASYLDFLGLLYISAALERLILFLYPTLVLLLGALLFRRRVEWRHWLAVVLSYIGIALVVGSDFMIAGNGIMLGASLVFGSALCFAVYLAVSERLLLSLGSVRFTAYAMSVSCCACIIQFVLTHNLAMLEVPAAVYRYSLAMAIFSTVLPAFMVSAGIQRIGSGPAAMIATVGPVATIVLAHVFLAEPITALQMLGTAFVLAGVVFVTGTTRR